MKNFKRVISAVIALALSASTLVAVSAAKFTDVDDTNVNAEAINALAALDVVSGYEDGSFNPEGDITRAEAARMIVSALNMNADADAAKGTSRFTDVNEQASWASGFINVGVAQGYINGMDDTTFAPQSKVTYAQMCTMLTIILGYKTYAEANGGYPKGFMEMAAAGGVNKGVSLAADTPLKRGQVARMVYNTVTAPILGITEYKTSGDTYEQLDGIGTSKPKKTLLSDKFSAIEAKVSVDAFPAAGEVTLTMVDDYHYGRIAEWSKFSGLVAGANVINDKNIDLSSYLQQQVNAIISVDANSKLHLVYVTATNAVTTKEIAATSQYDTNIPGTTQIKFGTAKETFQGAVDVYVNGYQYPTAGTSYVLPGGAAPIVGTKALSDVLYNAVGTIKLAKVASGVNNYDTILLDAYQIGKVSNVEYENGKTTVDFTPNAKNIGDYTSISFTDNEVENGSVKINVTLDGEAIELKDLKKGDVIAIKTKIVPGATTINYTNGNVDSTILVSRQTISGKVTAIDTEDDANKFTVAGTDYAAVDKTGIGLALNTVYNIIYLDPFGRIAAYDDEEIEETHNYGIVAKIDGEDVTLVLADGSTRTYEVKSNDVFVSAYNAGSSIYAADTISLSSAITTAMIPAANRVPNDSKGINSVVEYTLKSGKITSLIYQAPTAFINTNASTKGEYRAEVQRIGVVGINSSTNIINSDDPSYKKYESWSISQLSDGEKYAGIGFGKINGTSIYSLVLITDAGYKYGAGARFAVMDTAQWSAGQDADGDTVDQLKVLVNGQKTTLNFEKKFANSADPNYFVPVRGTAFFYTVDSDGLVDGVKPITMAQIATNGGVTLAGAFGSDYDPAKWETTLINGTKDYRLVQGIVVKASESKISLATIPTTNGPVDFGNYETLTLADDCIVYTYNTKAEENNNKLNAKGSVQASDFSNWKIAVAPGSEQVASVAVPANGSYGSGDIGKTVWTTALVAPSNISTAYNGSNDDATAELFAAARGIKTGNAAAIANKTTEQAAKYAMALEIDGQVVEIYEIIQ